MVAISASSLLEDEKNEEIRVICHVDKGHDHESLTRSITGEQEDNGVPECYFSEWDSNEQKAIHAYVAEASQTGDTYSETFIQVGTDGESIGSGSNREQPAPRAPE